MMKPFALLSSLAWIVAADVVVEQTTNPHIKDSCASDDFTHLLEAPLLYPFATQSDTFHGMRFAKTKSGTQVAMYDFTQSRRLSEAELPFSVVPVRDVPGLLTSSAYNDDSWFVGYSWQVIGTVNSCGELIHLGWRYTSPTDTFLALIVRADERQRSLTVGTAAPAAIAALLVSFSSKHKSLHTTSF